MVSAQETAGWGRAAAPSVTVIWEGLGDKGTLQSNLPAEGGSVKREEGRQGGVTYSLGGRYRSSFGGER